MEQWEIQESSVYGGENKDLLLWELRYMLCLHSSVNNKV